MKKLFAFISFMYEEKMGNIPTIDNLIDYVCLSITLLYSLNYLLL